MKSTKNNQLEITIKMDKEDLNSAVQGCLWANIYALESGDDLKGCSRVPITFLNMLMLEVVAQM